MLENGMVLEMDRHLNSLEEQELPVCPACGCDCETFYLDGNNQVCGCENCVSTEEAYILEDDENI